MNTKEKYTISEATNLLGFTSRSTINKRTKSKGNDSISYNIDENGVKVISIIELQRVFPDRIKDVLSKKENTKDTSTKIQSNTMKNPANTVWLEQKLELTEQRLEQERFERERERQESKEREQKSEDREEHFRDQVNELVKTISHQTRLLEHHQEKPTNQADLKKKSRPNKLIQETSKELIKTFKFASIAALVIIALIITVFIIQEQSRAVNKKTSKPSTVSKEKINSADTTKHLRNGYKNYSPIPE